MRDVDIRDNDKGKISDPRDNMTIDTRDNFNIDQPGDVMFRDNP